MPHRASHIVAISTALIVAAAPLGAHDTWLVAHHGYVPAGGAVTFDMSSGGHFPTNESAISADRVALSGWRLAGAVHTLRPGRPAAGALRFRETMPTAGIAMTWVSLHPRVLTLKASLVKEYTDEIGAPSEFYSAWQSAADKTWRERYSKHAKSFVRVGANANDSSWAVHTGQPYELVPMQNPTSLAAGDSLTVLALHCGQPLANVAVGSESGGSGHAAIVKTDAAGKARVAFTRPGRWLVSSTYLSFANRAGQLCEQSLPGDTVAVGYVSQFATMTLDVGRRLR